VAFQGERAFWAVSSAQLVSSVGSGMTRFGLSLWVLSETGDVTAYTGLLFFAFLPIGIGSLVAGPLVDRLDRRQVMLVANALPSLSTLAVAGLYFTDHLEIWHLFIALFANGFANSFILPAFEASVPLMMPREKLGSAAGFTQMILALETIAAPALAGIVISLFDLGALFLIDFGTFAFALVALLTARIPNPAWDEDHEHEPVFRAFRTGLRYVRERAPLRRLFVLVTSLMFVNAGFGFALCTPLVMSFAGERAAGIVMSSFGVGALIGGALLATTGGPRRRMDGILIGLAFAALSSWIIAAREDVWIVAFGVLAVGATFMFVMGLVRVILQEKVDPLVLGRVASLRLALGTIAQVSGIALAGPIAEAFFEPLMLQGGALADTAGALLGTGEGRGIALMYWLIGASLLVVTAIAFSSRRLRLLEDELPDFAPANG
jgi:MFS family permease